MFVFLFNLFKTHLGLAKGSTFRRLCIYHMSTSTTLQAIQLLPLMKEKNLSFSCSFSTYRYRKFNSKGNCTYKSFFPPYYVTWEKYWQVSSIILNDRKGYSWEQENPTKQLGKICTKIGFLFRFSFLF